MDKDKIFLKFGMQYVKSAIYLMNAICRSGNQTGAIANTEKEAKKKMYKKIELSDLTLLLPALFSCYHGLELYAKGLLFLQKDTTVPLNHNVQELLQHMNKYYKNTPLLNLISDTYTMQDNMINSFKHQNNLIDSHEFYESLRYPLSKSNKLYDYSELHYNGTKGVEELKKIIKNLKKINKLVLKEYLNSSIKKHGPV